MITVSPSLLIGAALVMALVGCQKKDEPAVTSSGQPSPSVTSTTTAVPQASTSDPSLPKAAGQATDTQGATTLQRKADPQDELTKAEESKAMPLPGQANDHSTTALDKSK